MRVLKFLLQKEFRQIFRDPSIFRVLFIAPLAQLLILPLAANYQIKNINLAVVDNDHSQYSQILINKITSSGYFRLKEYSATFPQALRSVELDKSDIILEIPADFQKKLIKDSEADLFVAANAINRAMGQPDLYPFQLPQGVVGKLDYINRLVQRAASGAIEDRPSPSTKSEAEVA